MIENIGNGLAAFVKEHPILTLLFIGIGSLEYVQWSFGKFVTFTHKMRLHWRRMVGEPDPKVLHS